MMSVGLNHPLIHSNYLLTLINTSNSILRITSMDYKRIYENLMIRAQTRILDGYGEMHHIVPRCMQGDNSKSNLVKLTAREHFIAHVLLVKIYPNNSKLIHAAHILSNMGKYNSKKYEWLKIKHAIAVSDIMSGRIVSQETKDKISNNKVRNQKISDAHKGKKLTQVHKDNLSKSCKNKKLSQETRNKISLANQGEKNNMFGKTHTEESKAIIIAANIQQVICPHCAKQGAIAAMNRWHFDKCPSNPNAIPRPKFKIRECPHCKLTGGGMRMTKNHFDNCKHRKDN